MNTLGSPSTIRSWPRGSGRRSNGQVTATGKVYSRSESCGSTRWRVRFRVRSGAVELSAREFALLRALAAEPTRVFTKEELLRDVWGFKLMGTSRRGPMMCAVVFTPRKLAHRGRRKLDPETAELPGDPLIPERAFSRARRTTSSRNSPPTRGWLGPRRAYVERLATSWRCQRRSVSGLTNSERQRLRGSRRVAAARKARPAGRSSGLRVWRRRICVLRSFAGIWKSRTYLAH